MEKLISVKHNIDLSRCLIILLTMIVIAGTSAMAQRYGVATGAWGSTSTWAAASGGAAGASVPTSGTAVTIERGHTVTVDIPDAVCASLTLGGSGSAGTLGFVAAGDPALTVSGPVQIGAPSSGLARGTITFQSGSRLTCNGLAMGNSFNTASSTITMTSGGTLTINGTLTAPGTGTHTWTPGTGTVVFGSTNTLPAGTFTAFNNLTISGGATTLGAAITTVGGAVTVNAGATLVLAAFALGGATAPTEVTLYCGATIGSSITGTTGALNLGGDLTVINAATGISGATISAPVVLGATPPPITRTFTVADDGTSALDLSISGVISDNNKNHAVTKAGPGTIALSGPNAFHGAMTINQGTLQYAANNVLAANPVVVNDGGTYDLNGFSDAIGALTVNSGTIGGTVTTGAGTLTLGSNVTSTGGASNATISGNVALQSNRTFTVTNPADELIVSAVIRGPGNGITKAGNGMLTLSGSNAFTGAVTINSGTLAVNTLAAAGQNSSLGTGSKTPNISIGATGILRYTGTGHSTNRSIVLTGIGAILDASGSGTLTLSGGVTGNTFDLNLTGTGTGIESGVIATTTGTVTKSGAGTWTLSGVNTFRGAVTIDSGTLAATSLAGAGPNSSLGTGSATSAISIGSAGTLRYVGTGHSTSRAIVLTGSGATLDASGSGTLTLSGGVTGNTFDLTLTGTGTGIESGVIATTTGTVTKNGSGSWTLLGADTYTGATIINAGTLHASAADFSTSTKSYLDINGGFTVPRDTLIYTLNVRNSGNHVAASTNIVDSLPSYVTLVPGSITGGGSYAGGKITFQTLSLGINDSVRLTYRVTVDTTIPNQYVATNTATLYGYHTTHVLYASFTPLNRPIMSITKSVDKANVNPGDTVTTTISYSNQGTAAAAFVTVTDPAPANSVYVLHSIIVNGVLMTDAVDTDAASITNNQIFVNVGIVQPGKSGTITFKVRIR